MKEGLRESGNNNIKSLIMDFLPDCAKITLEFLNVSAKNERKTILKQLDIVLNCFLYSYRRNLEGSCPHSLRIVVGFRTKKSVSYESLRYDVTSFWCQNLKKTKHPKWW